jgi:hypothetical protein
MNNLQNLRRNALLIGAISGLFGCDDAPAAPKMETTSAAEAGTSSYAQAQGRRIAFADLEIFFEFNATDNDLGAQISLDAEGWNQLSAANPDGNNILDIIANNELGTLGITELRFETAEPSPEVVLGLFEAGTYDFAGQTVNGDRLEGTATLSHALPPAPVFTPADGDVVDPANTVIMWNPISGLAGFEVMVENVRTGRSMSVLLAPSATTLHVPTEFMEPRSSYKAEILAISTNGNKTITEHSFTTSK